ncbi:hypothetical protein [Tessaracoccus sp. Y1736]
MPLSLLLTIGLTIVILAIAAGVTARSRRARPAVMGVGWALLPVGLYLTGLTQVIVDGVRAFIDWLMRTPWTVVTSWGLGLFVGGVLLIVIAAFLPRTRKTTAPSAPQQPAAQGKRPQVASPAPAAKPAAQAPQPAAQKGVDPEDAEIEALLRKRGIM